MRILIEINHPCQVHKLKNLIHKLELKNNILVLSRNKDVTLDLLKAYKIKNICISKHKKLTLWLVVEFIQRNLSAFYYILKFKPDVMFGFSAVNICILGRLFGIRTVLFADTEDAGIISKLTFPYASRIIIPETFKKHFGKREIRFKGTHELSYLMNFKPNNSIYSILGIKKTDQYVLLRFISWGASHDISEKGFTNMQKEELIRILEKIFKVFISCENKLPIKFQKYKLNIPPDRIHDVLYFADLFVGESQSMATESALLGTPALRFNSLVGKMHGFGQFKELQEQKLVYSTNDEKELLQKVNMVLQMKDRKLIWKQRKDSYLKNKDNPSDYAFRTIMGIK